MAAALPRSVKNAIVATTRSLPKLVTASMIMRMEKSRLMPVSGLTLDRLGISGLKVNSHPI